MKYIYRVEPGGNTQQHKQTKQMKNTHKHLFHLDFVEIISPHEGVIRGLASIDNLTNTTNTDEHIAEYNHTKRNLLRNDTQ